MLREHRNSTFGRSTIKSMHRYWDISGLYITSRALVPNPRLSRLSCRSYSAMSSPSCLGKDSVRICTIVILFCARGKTILVMHGVIPSWLEGDASTFHYDQDTGLPPHGNVTFVLQDSSLPYHQPVNEQNHHRKFPCIYVLRPRLH